MPRLRSIIVSATVLVSCFFAAGASHGEDAATPWGGASDANASVADWANTKFAPKTASAVSPPASKDRYASAGEPNQLSLPPNKTFTPFVPPAADRYSTASHPPRLTRLQGNPLPAGNPLRGASKSSFRVEPPAGLETAAAFPAPPATVRLSAPAPFQPAAEEPRRIAIGATPRLSPAPVEPIKIAPEDEFDAPTKTEEVAPWDNPASIAETRAKPEPIRVAAASVEEATMEEPSAFQSAYQSPPARESNQSAYQSEMKPAASFRAAASFESTPAPAEGIGRPGSSDLEGPQEASLVVEKRGPSEARIGQPCRFAVRVRNAGRAAAENVMLTDQVPAGAKLISTNPTADHQNGKLVWRLGAIASGEERTVEMKLEPVREGPLGSVAKVSMDAVVSASTIATRPQLAVRMSAPPRVLIGGEQIVSIEVHNPGTGSATNVILTEDVPSAVRHPAGAELEFEVGTLEPGATRRIELKLKAAEAGRVVNAVTVVADGNLRAEKSVEFDIVAPSLAVTIEGPKRRYLERPASYTIGVDNPGTAPAKDVRLVTHLPRGMEFVKANNLGEYDATTHSVYWSLAELPEGERGEVKVVAMPVTPGEHTLKAESEAASGLEAKHAHRIQVEGIASLAFEVRDMQDPIEVGDDTVYEIRVLNEGTKAATGVIVRVEAPTGLRIAAAEGKTAGRTSASRAEFAALPRLEPGEKVAYRVKVTGAEAGDQRVTVLVESDELDRPIRREESTRVYGDE